MITGCKDISRTDMILSDGGEIVVLEINTVPGMTKTSFVPEEMRVAGYTLSQFVEGMIRKYS
jgi:D-alanine-D-alanine ligase-like ATP-grasp enzyme